ncbi:MAG: glycosyltransferase family 2 protein [Patescibacteria group bacterium]
MRDIEISVVMPVKNGEKRLATVLDSVFAQEIDVGFEVIIVDSGSNDTSLEIIKKYPVEVYHIPEHKFNHGLTRNYLISKSRGEFIVLLTQDAVPRDNYWMKKLVDELKQDSMVAGVYSRQIPHRDASIITRMRSQRFYAASGERRESCIRTRGDYDNLSANQKHKFCNFENVSSCIRKAVWKKYPFPKTDFAEDLLWSKTVLENGFKVIYKPESVVYHSHDFSAWGWYRRNLINYSALHAIFGMNTAESLRKLPKIFFFYALRDLCQLIKEGGCPRNIISNIHLIPIFSFTGVLGQHLGIKNSKRRR